MKQIVSTSSSAHQEQTIIKEANHQTSSRSSQKNAPVIQFFWRREKRSQRLEILC